MTEQRRTEEAIPTSRYPKISDLDDKKVELDQDQDDDQQLPIHALFDADQLDVEEE